MTTNGVLQLVLYHGGAAGRWSSRWAGSWPASIEGKPCGLDRWLALAGTRALSPRRRRSGRRDDLAAIRRLRCWCSTCSACWPCMACSGCSTCCRSTRRRCRRVTPDLSFNTAVSFATNTNWQGYGGETTLSYLTQMLGLTVQNFVSAATGMAVLVALIRGFARQHDRRRSATSGSI